MGRNDHVPMIIADLLAQPWVKSKSPIACARYACTNILCGSAPSGRRALRLVIIPSRFDFRARYRLASGRKGKLVGAAALGIARQI